MDLSPCALCNVLIESPVYNLQKTHTSWSKNSLIIVLEQCVQNFTSSASNICVNCYYLLNELDRSKLRVKSIEEQLQSYVTKCKIDTGSNPPVKSEQSLVKDNAKNQTEEFELANLETSFVSQQLAEINRLGVPELEIIKVEHAPMENIDTNLVKPFSCSQCSKTWKTASELKSHISTHSKEKPHVCEICGQAYKHQNALTVHVGMHKGIHPFKCTLCNKSFTQKGALSRHMPKHTGELPFQCDLCGKRFVHHTSFNIHKLSHTGEKLFKCQQCGLALISRSHLKRHEKVHTGEKKFGCSVCGKRFAEKYNLGVHVKGHLGIHKFKKFQCTICGSSYNRQTTLDYHLLSAHQNVKRFSGEKIHA